MFFQQTSVRNIRHILNIAAVGYSEKLTVVYHTKFIALQRTVKVKVFLYKPDVALGLAAD